MVQNGERIFSCLHIPCFQRKTCKSYHNFDIHLLQSTSGLGKGEKSKALHIQSRIQRALLAQYIPSEISSEV